ncbi:MAG: antibiotic biosynthesis monooxygenase [Hydrogenophaga sp.]|uniref:antibiotic biosynthesis monooxygenase family protein n=1 Tax=Hydrogenophaga sp. TaxID=1904254 RepID=UPI002769083E|nr:antibiotic biosynthesis monooxygenase [Hydrogenophaga sp.]MDP2417916.1 antibiotic biosynthesis monooxygenase [Hydrogenophaga sp.]MDZ4188389.1 antibiotic biosynthesis monooxygenase [Hydrogenophaga sp.]
MNDQSGFAKLPVPPYYAVIFSSLRTAGDHGYDDMGQRMVELACQQLGYLGAESARNIDGFGITVSYWTDETSILTWKRHAEHQIAQETGKQRWYEHYETRVAKVERAYALK